jgi:PAS domain S-box-containing protein
MNKPTYEELEKQLRKLEKEYDEYKKETKNLSKSQENFKALFDRNLHCIFVHDFEGNFLDANAAALNLLGYRREELHSINFATLIDENQLPKAFAAIETIKQNGSLHNFL